MTGKNERLSDLTERPRLPTHPAMKRLIGRDRAKVKRTRRIVDLIEADKQNIAATKER